MSVRQVTANPVQVSGVFSDPYVVRNSGTVPVYIGTDSSLSVATRSSTVDPGGTVTWESNGMSLWAVTDPGLTGELEMIYNSKFASTPGPSTVNIGNKVNVIPASRAFDVAVVDMSFTSNQFSTLLPLTKTGALDGMATLFFRLTTYASVPDSYSIPNYSVVMLEWFNEDESTGAVVQQQFSINPDSQLLYRIPVIADRLRVNMFNQTGSVTVNLYIGATSVVLPSEYRSSWTDSQCIGGNLSNFLNTPEDGILSFDVESTAALTQIYLPNIAGRAQLRAQIASNIATPAMTLTVYGGSGLRSYLGTATLAAGATAGPNVWFPTLDFLTPRQPLRVNWNSQVGAVIRVSVVYN